MLLSICVALIIIRDGVDACTSTTNLVAESNTPQHVKYPQARNDYPVNQDRCWLISSGGGAILISITTTTINNDFVRIYDGNTTGASRVFEKNAGTDYSEKIVTTSGNALVRFTSDNTADAGKDVGFHMYFVTGTGTACDRKLPLATDSEHYLTSPNFPNTYGLSSTCTWTIEADSHSAGLEVNLVFMDIEYRPFCDYDYLQIVDDLGEGTEKMCGTDWFPSLKYTTQNSMIQIKLASDSIEANHGFVLTYKETDPMVDINLIILSIFLVILSLMICVFGTLYCISML